MPRGLEQFCLDRISRGMSNSDSNVKQLVVTGGAADSYLHKGTRKRRSSAKHSLGETRKADQEGGTSPGTLVGLAASRGPITANAPVVKASNEGSLSRSVTNSTPATVASASVTSASVPSAPISGGAQKAVKVVLAAGKKKTKVILGPSKVKKEGGAPITHLGSKTRKVAKKIRMSLGGFGKRVTRANSIRHDAKKQSLESVKKTLQDAKLIKADSKAPESVLRQMYSDYMMLKNRAL